jgi:hypothetical protein
MKAPTSKGPKWRTALTKRSLRRGRRCTRCPLCTPSGACRNPALKSGRCGDWVWYMLGDKQLRRIWVKPRDPRTPGQLRWRALMAAASRKYSRSLTDAQLDACMAAAAKRQSRRRMGQAGPLTAQQFWVGQACSTAAKALQTQEISRLTWETHRSISVVPQGQHRRNTGRARERQGRRKNEECGRPKLTRMFHAQVAADVRACCPRAFFSESKLAGGNSRYSR